MKNNSIFLPQYFVLVFLIIGCTLNEPTATQTISPQSSPTLQPSPTNQAILTDTISELFLKPTLPVEDSYVMIYDLLINSNCEQPCWWGINPGRTKIVEAHVIFSQFLGIVKDEDHYTFSESEGSLIIQRNSWGFGMSIQYSGKDKFVDRMIISTSQIGEAPNYPNIYGDTRYKDLLNNYTLENVLATFGPPSSIWLRAFAEAPNWSPSRTLLLYRDRGIAFEYISPTKYSGPEIVWTCPSEGRISIRLFDTSVNLTSEEILSQFVNLELYLPLSHASNMDTDTFTTQFSNDDCSSGIETPENLWPSV